MPVQQVPAGGEGGPGGLPNLLKEEIKDGGEEEGLGGDAGQPGSGGGHDGHHRDAQRQNIMHTL